METWYKAAYGKIEEVNVIRATDKQVVLEGGRRAIKETDYCWYAPTRDEARSMMVEQYRKECEWNKKRYELTLERLEQAKNA